MVIEAKRCPSYLKTAAELARIREAGRVAARAVRHTIAVTKSGAAVLTA